MKIVLCNLTWDVVDAWKHAFAGTPVQAQQGNILSVGADAIVSPANSFGYMDGGIDLVYSQHFGWDLEKSLRDKLIAEWDGELPVGNAVIVPITGSPFKWLVSAPTMRVPSRVDKTTNAYLAFRAVLRAVRAHNLSSPTPIRSLACPGLGTGEGRMPPDRCARQMRHAYDVVIGGQLLLKGGLAGSVRNHIELLR